MVTDCDFSRVQFQLVLNRNITQLVSHLIIIFHVKNEIMIHLYWVASLGHPGHFMTACSELKKSALTQVCFSALKNY